MKRPNRGERIKMQDEYFNKYNDKSYLQALEKYASTLEKQLTIPVVVGTCCDGSDIALKNKIRLADLDRCAK